MALPVACVCGHEWPDLEGFEGQLVKCPKCGNRNRVPGKPRADAPEPAPQTPPPDSLPPEPGSSGPAPAGSTRFGKPVVTLTGTVQSPNAEKYKDLAKPKLAWDPSRKPRPARESREDRLLVSRIQMGEHVLQARCEAAYQSRAVALLEQVRELAGPEGDFPPNFRFPFNWFVLGVVARVEDRFLGAPNFQRNPYEDFIDDLTRVFEITAAQEQIVEKARVRKAMPCLFTDEILIARQCLDYRLVHLHRKDFPTQGKSGWHIGPGDPADVRRLADDPRRWETMPAFRLLELRPKLIEYLMLPTGFQVHLNGDEVELILNANGTPAWRPELDGE
ncbi:MAG: hypothetical protein M5U26_01885 [Planctomycetota bacterium]|nr:hypothetical protein [Planctomycetota bacterium]